MAALPQAPFLAPAPPDGPGPKNDLTEFPVAVGQPNPPVRPTARTRKADTSESRKQERIGLNTLERLAVFGWIILHLPPLAILFGGFGLTGCWSAAFLLLINYIVFFTLMLYLSEKITCATLVKLWQMCLSMIRNEQRPELAPVYKPFQSSSSKK